MREASGSLLPGLVLNVSFGVVAVMAMREAFGIPGFDDASAAHTSLVWLTPAALATGAGIGLLRPDLDISPAGARPGDAVLLNGPIADHGVAILSVREGLEFETSIESDSAALSDLVETLLDAGGDAVHVLRDPTRGGIASALNEIATAAATSIRLDEKSIPVREEVRGACEILGLDPLYVANEGKCLAIVAPDAAVRFAEHLLSI